jgi:hypothetical protein
MRISPKYSAYDWKKIAFQNEEEWLLAIDIFQDRIKERFLDPIARIEACAYAGFAVLALDCLLIEMLQQFREGIYRTPSGQSKDYFVRFLTETSFGEYFDKRKAELFYRQIRSGILHQAEIRGSSKVLIEDDVPLVDYTDDNKGLIVNRKAFHDQLLREFEIYVTALQDPASLELRERFKKKMTSVCKTACEII